MTSPIEEVVVICPQCQAEYKDWYRGSINLGLDDFDEKYIDECSSATCPSCGFKVYFETLVVREDGVFVINI